MSAWASLTKSQENVSQYSYDVDGGENFHFTTIHHKRWKSRQENQMLPILVPNIGFKKFSEIKPNQGILHQLAPKGIIRNFNFVISSVR